MSSNEPDKVKLPAICLKNPLTKGGSGSANRYQNQSTLFSETDEHTGLISNRVPTPPHDIKKQMSRLRKRFTETQAFAKENDAFDTKKTTPSTDKNIEIFEPRVVVSKGYENIHSKLQTKPLSEMKKSAAESLSDEAARQQRVEQAIVDREEKSKSTRPSSARERRVSFHGSPLRSPTPPELSLEEIQAKFDNMTPEPDYFSCEYPAGTPRNKRF